MYTFSRQHLTIKNSIRFDRRKLQPTSNVNASCDNVTSTDDPVKKSSDGEREKETIVCIQGAVVQGSPKECFPGLVNFVTAVYHFYLNLPRTFSQPGKHSFGDPCNMHETTYIINK